MIKLRILLPAIIQWALHVLITIHIRDLTMEGAKELWWQKQEEIAVIWGRGHEQRNASSIWKLEKTKGKQNKNQSRSFCSLKKKSVLQTSWLSPVKRILTSDLELYCFKLPSLW